VILDPRDAVQWEFIKWMIDAAVELVFHFSCFDVPNLAMNKLIQPRHAWKCRDGVLTARLAEPGNLVSKNLASCASRYLGYTTDKDGMLTSARAVGMRGKEQMYREFDLERLRTRSSPPGSIGRCERPRTAGSPTTPSTTGASPATRRGG
jgi:hypothetical protein